jgi:hypothetical protein
VNTSAASVLDRLTSTRSKQPPNTHRWHLIIGETQRALPDNNLEEGILWQDNLKAQLSPAYVRALIDVNILSEYSPADTTDIVQVS